MIEFALVPLLVGLLLLTAICRALDSIALSLDWPWWISLACVTAAIALLVLIAVARNVLQEVRVRREHSELSGMEQRYPGCHVLKLQSGQWFLTVRSTGREYTPGAHPHHVPRFGKTRDGCSAWLQQVSDETRARADSNARR